MANGNRGKDRVEYDPISYDNIVRSVVSALLSQPIEPLTTKMTCAGSGIYAIYYVGVFGPYGPIASRPPRVPIYVGKAIPPGRRKGQRTEEPASLASRLGQHARSLQLASNLQLEDFLCRALPVREVWIPLSEQMLIQIFRPLWNCLVDGFGNHDPGSGRKSMIRPRWDTLHPGRPWASMLEEKHRVEEIIAEVREYLHRLDLKQPISQPCVDPKNS